MKRREGVPIITLSLLVLAGPTVGDIGSCGQDVVELDPEKFFREKEFIDCNRCAECGLSTVRCEDACDDDLEQTTFEEHCFPLVHDGEVCLNALRAASCGDYAGYVDDAAPTVPTECNFCPVEGRP